MEQSKRKYYIWLLVMSMLLILVKYVMTSCFVMCMDWHDSYVIGYSDHGIPITRKDLDGQD